MQEQLDKEFERTGKSRQEFDILERKIVELNVELDHAKELNRNRERSMNVIQDQLDSKSELVSKLNTELQVYECQRLGLKTAHETALGHGHDEARKHQVEIDQLRQQIHNLRVENGKLIENLKEKDSLRQRHHTAEVDLQQSKSQLLQEREQWEARVMRQREAS